MRCARRWVALMLIALTGRSLTTYAQDVAAKFTRIDPKPFEDNTHHWYDIFDKDNVINPRPGKPEYEPTDITRIADNILLLQKDNGGWPKNYDIMAILSPEQEDSLRRAKSILNTTYDNGSTYTEVAALADVYTATKIAKYKTGALKGLDFILASQYKNGGWPQYYPLEDNYSRCVTYNDGVFVGIVQLLKDILDNEPQYAFVDKDYRRKLQAAYDKAIPCILKTQINDAGKPTAWCQQYDEVTLQPAWARKFEPPSICNRESADLVLFLMSIDHPSKQVVDAVQNAVAWFEQSKIYNTRIETIDAPPMVTKYKISTHDRVVVVDSAAPPIWTRYYELKTHRPLFCNRDSKVVYSLAEVDRERRDGYGWYTYQPKMVLKAYHKWQQKWAKDADVLRGK
ncbi:MAG: pectate lyase [Flavipsychrobacter sp.]|nr:pectate lyase [Flavipsychrobacter sp.]